MPVLPHLGIVLEGLSKPPYERLREAPPKHLTLKTVFLLPMASARRCSELSSGQVLLYILAPSSCASFRNILGLTTPVAFQRVPTGHSDFGAPNCPVRAL